MVKEFVRDDLHPSISKGYLYKALPLSSVPLSTTMLLRLDNVRICSKPRALKSGRRDSFARCALLPHRSLSKARLQLHEDENVRSNGLCEGYRSELTRWFEV